MAVDKTKIAHERAKMSLRAKILQDRLAIDKGRENLKRNRENLKQLSSLGKARKA